MKIVLKFSYVETHKIFCVSICFVCWECTHFFNILLRYISLYAVFGYHDMSYITHVQKLLLSSNIYHFPPLFVNFSILSSLMPHYTSCLICTLPRHKTISSRSITLFGCGKIFQNVGKYLPVNMGLY